MKEPEFKAKIVCKFCRKTGHYENACWTKQKVERKAKAEAKKTEKSNQKPAESAEKKRKHEQVTLVKTKATTLYLPVQHAGQELRCIVDTGATISCIAKCYVADQDIMLNTPQAVRVGDGSTIMSHGSTKVTIQLGPETIKKEMIVLETSAFEAVLGLDFLGRSPVEGILMRPARLVVSGSQVPFIEESQPRSIHIIKFGNNEAYKLLPNIRDAALKQLQIPAESITIDLFASYKNAQEALFCSMKNNAFWYDWSALVEPNQWLWANPPFSKLERILTKVILEGVRVVLCCPDWGTSTKWRQLLDQITVDRITLPDEALYATDSGKVLPKPHWASMLSLLDPIAKPVPRSQLNPDTVTNVMSVSRGWGLNELRRYCEAEKVNPLPAEAYWQPRRAMKDASTLMEDKPKLPYFIPIEEPTTPAFSNTSTDSLMAELKKEVEAENHWTARKPRRRTRKKKTSSSFLSTKLQCQADDRRAIPSSPFKANQKDLAEMCKPLTKDLTVLRMEQTDAKFQTKIAEDIEVKDIVEGEVKKEMETQVKSNPELQWLEPLLQDHLEVFSALPAPGTVPKIVKLNLQLKEEFKDVPLRSKCFPMSKEDATEIEKQVLELTKAGLAEEYTGSEFPRFCSPTFLVMKEKGKDTKTTRSKRMVGDYRKLNARTVAHAGFLPSLEANVESLANTQVQVNLGHAFRILAGGADQRSTGTDSLRHTQWPHLPLEDHAIWPFECTRHFPRTDAEAGRPHEGETRSQKSDTTRMLH